MVQCLYTAVVPTNTVMCCHMIFERCFVLFCHVCSVTVHIFKTDFTVIFFNCLLNIMPIVMLLHILLKTFD